MDFVEDGGPSPRPRRRRRLAPPHPRRRPPRPPRRPEGWIDGAFREVFDALGAHPRARLDPEAPPLAETLDALRGRRTLGAALDPSFDSAARRRGLVREVAPERTCRRSEVAATLRMAAADPCSEAMATVRACTAAAPRRRARSNGAPTPATPSSATRPSRRATPLVQALTALRLSRRPHVRAGGRRRARAHQGPPRRPHPGRPPAPALRRPRRPRRGDALASAIGARYDAALVDEFQDTDPYQLAIFRRAFAGRPTFFVGDPKQAIYAFRGADLFAYLGARGARGDPAASPSAPTGAAASALVDAVNALFARPARPFLYDGIPYEPRPAPPHRRRRAASPATARGALVWWTFEPAPSGKTGREGRRSSPASSTPSCTRSGASSHRRLTAIGRRAAPARRPRRARPHEPRRPRRCRPPSGRRASRASSASGGDVLEPARPTSSSVS